MMNEGIETGRIEISMQVVGQDQFLDVDAGDLSAIAILGMLEMAKDAILHPPSGDDHGEV